MIPLLCHVSTPRISSARAFLSFFLSVSSFLPFCLFLSFPFSFCLYQPVFIINMFVFVPCPITASFFARTVVDRASHVTVSICFYIILPPFWKVWHAALCVKHSNRQPLGKGNRPRCLMHLELPCELFAGHAVQIADTYLIWIMSGVFGCLRNDFRPFHPVSGRRKPFKSLKLPKPAFLVPMESQELNCGKCNFWKRKIHIFADGMPSCIQAVHGLLCQRFSSQAVLSDHHLSSKSRGWSWDSDFRCFSQVNSIEEYPMQPTKSQEHVWHARILCKPAFAKDSSSCFLSGCCKPQKVVVKNVGREATQTKHNTHASKDVQIWSTATSFLIKSSSSGWNCKWL